MKGQLTGFRRHERLPCYICQAIKDLGVFMTAVGRALRGALRRLKAALDRGEAKRQLKGGSDAENRDPEEGQGGQGEG